MLQRPTRETGYGFGRTGANGSSVRGTICSSCWWRPLALALRTARLAAIPAPCGSSPAPSSALSGELAGRGIPLPRCVAAMDGRLDGQCARRIAAHLDRFRPSPSLVSRFPNWRWVPVSSCSAGCAAARATSQQHSRQRSDARAGGVNLARVLCVASFSQVAHKRTILSMAKLGFLGLGMMGYRWRATCFAPGMKLHSGPTRGKGAQMADAEKGRCCATPKEVAENADCVFLCVGNTQMARRHPRTGWNRSGARAGTVVAMPAPSAPAKVAKSAWCSRRRVSRCSMRRAPVPPRRREWQPDLHDRWRCSRSRA